MSVGAAAERYAQALFELGLEAGELDALVRGFQKFAETYSEQRELARTLNNPVVDRQERSRLIEAVCKRCGAPQLVVQGLVVMAVRRRLPAVHATARKLTELSDKHLGVLRARITTADKMPESYYRGLVTQLQKATGKTVVLERQEDPNLIGGAVAHVGDAIIDGSLRGKLDGLLKGFRPGTSWSAPASQPL